MQETVRFRHALQTETTANTLPLHDKHIFPHIYCPYMPS